MIPATVSGESRRRSLRWRQIDNGLRIRRNDRPRCHAFRRRKAVTCIIRPDGAHDPPLVFHIGPCSALEHGRILPCSFAAKQERKFDCVAVTQAGIRTVPREIEKEDFLACLGGFLRQLSSRLYHSLSEFSELSHIRTGLGGADMTEFRKFT